LLEIEHVSIRVGELAQPLAPFHLLGRHGEFDAQFLHPLVVREDVVSEERDPGRTWLGLVHLAHVYTGLRTERTQFDPMTCVLRRPLDRRVGVRDPRSDVRDIEADAVAKPKRY